LKVLKMKRSLGKLVTDQGACRVQNGGDRCCEKWGSHEQQQPGDGEEGKTLSEPARHERIIGPRPMAEGPGLRPSGLI
jgi:hypothetical protein